VIVIETVKTLENPYVLCFILNGGRLARDANGGPADWANFERKIHKSVEGRLYFICTNIGINTFSFSFTAVFDVKQTNKYITTQFMNTSHEIEQNTINTTNKRTTRHRVKYENNNNLQNSFANDGTP
jgi:hypothetical protein